MKTLLTIGMILLCPVIAHAETFAFVDPARVYAESTEAQRAAAEVQADRDTKQREINAAQAEIEKAQLKCNPTHTHVSDGVQSLDAPCPPADAIRKKAGDLAKMDQADLSKHQSAVGAALQRRIADVVAKLETEKRVTVLPLVPLSPKPGRDLTDELIKRLNAADTVAILEAKGKLEARVAKLEAEAKAKAPPIAAPVARK